MGIIVIVPLVEQLYFHVMLQVRLGTIRLMSKNEKKKNWQGKIN